MHRVARLFVAAALVAPLGGCAVFEAILSGLAEVAAGPRIVYATDPVDPDTPPFFGAVALTGDDAGLPIARKSLPFYGEPLRLRLSPDEAFAALSFLELGVVSEASLFVFDAANGATLAFETDNTLVDDVTAMCFDSQALRDLLAAIPGLIADGLEPPGTTASMGYDAEHPENEVFLIGWLDADRLLLRLKLEVTLQFDYPATGGSYDLGSGGGELYDLVYQADAGGAWAPTFCAESAVEAPAPPLPVPTRDVGIDAQGRITLDGAPLLNAVAPGGPVVVGPVAQVSGPFSTP